MTDLKRSRRPNSKLERTPELTPASASPGVFTPFRNRIFLAFWTASLVSSFGVLIQGVGASWLMTSIGPSVSMVTLVTVATVLPLVLFSLVAGAAADIWDRRTIMLVAQTIMLIVSAALAVITYFGLITPWLLLGLTFLLGCGAALHGPASQASVGDQVPREDLGGAVSLNGLGFNLARAVGPAVGGVVVAAAGPEAAFAVNTVSYVGLIVVLMLWHRPIAARNLPPETIPSAMRAGLRYSLLSPDIRTVLLRALVFGIFASALTSLMPLIARDRLEGTSLTFGLLLGFFGAGSVGGVLMSAWLRARFTNELVLRVVSLILGISAVIVGFSAWLPLTLAALFLAGAAWVLALSMFNVIVQLSAPRWVVGRAMAVIQTVMFGGFAAGSFGWGAFTEAQGLTTSLISSGLGVAASALLGLLFPIATLHSSNATSPAPDNANDGPEVDPRSGPVVTTVEYRVATPQAAAFVRQMWELRRIRRRDGGRNWALLNVFSDSEIWIERFESHTWLDYLRQSERVTTADAEVNRQVNEFHQGTAAPRVQHSLECSPSSFTATGSDRTDVGPLVCTTDPHLPAAQIQSLLH